MRLMRTRAFTRLVIGPVWFEVSDLFGSLQMHVALFRREGHSFPTRDRAVVIKVNR